MLLDPNTPVACPKCGQRLVYRGMSGLTQVYDCLLDGQMVLRPNWTIGPPREDERYLIVERPHEPPARSPRQPVIFRRHR